MTSASFKKIWFIFNDKHISKESGIGLCLEWIAPWNYNKRNTISFSDSKISFTYLVILIDSTDD